MQQQGLYGNKLNGLPRFRHFLLKPNLDLPHENMVVLGAEPILGGWCGALCWVERRLLLLLLL